MKRQIRSNSEDDGPLARLKPLAVFLRAGFAATAFLTAAVVLPLSSLAQNPGAAPALDPAMLAKLLQRIDALEAEVSALKSANPSPAPRPSLPPEITAAAIARVETASPVSELYPKVEFHLVGDITYTASNAPGSHNTFALGDVDPLITAQLSESASVLGDFVIASDQDGFAFETERMLLQYKVNDFLKFEVGRFHTMIGYYNSTYHNGTYFQTSVDRPHIFDFEDNGGILPIHSNGVSVNGEIPSGAWGAHYVLEVANGRDYASDRNPFAVEDTNDPKAVNLALFIRPEMLPGTQFGVSAYRDTLSLDGQPRIAQQIYSAYAAYKTRGIEWINEALLLRDAPHGGHAFTTTNFYTQFSRKFGPVRPFVRFEWRRTAAGDPVLAVSDQKESFRVQTVGLRYDFTPMMALKGEIERKTGEHGEIDTQATTQLTFRY